MQTLKKEATADKSRVVVNYKARMKWKIIADAVLWEKPSAPLPG